MKTSGHAERLSILAVVLSLTFWWGTSASAQDERAKPATTQTPSTTNLTTNPPPSPATSAGVEEIARMADAGVTMKVIRAYVECSETAYQPTDTDIIALKKHNVDDEIVTLMLKRGAQSRAALAQAKNEALARALASRTAAGGGFDPEGYNYFQYHYLQPRALESVYQRLAPYYYTPFPYAYGPPFRHP